MTAHPSVMSKFERIDCCRPDRVPTGGGWHWYHDRHCAIYPNQKMRETHPELFKPPPAWVRLSPLQPHDACRLAHADGGTPCSRCAPILAPTAYDEAHSDDASDWGKS
jgi:hypothetical protein